MKNIRLFSRNKRCSMLFLVSVIVVASSSELAAQIDPPKPPGEIIRATPGEPNPSWDVPPNRLFDGARPGVNTPETDAPFSANTNTSRDLWSGSEDPGEYPAYWYPGVTYQSPRIAPPQMSLYRNLVAADPISIGSFGPNQFCVWDTKLVIFSDSSNTQYISNAVLLDGGLSRQLLFEKDTSLYTGYGDGSTGEQAIEVQTREYVRLVPAQSNTMAQGDPRSNEFDHPFFTNTSNAGWVELHKFDGGKLHFEMVRDGDVLRGRLRIVEDRFGTTVQVLYQHHNFNSNNIDDMWKILEIHDRFGPAYSFDYGTQQHAGRWCVETIDVKHQNGGSVQYSYGSTTDSDPHNDGKLVGVTYADGNVATYSYGTDSGNTTIDWNDPASMGTFGRKIRVHVSGSSQAQNGNLGNQPTGVLVKVTTQDAPVETRLKVTHLVYPELLIEYGGTVMKLTPGGTKRYATQATDPCDHLEPVYAYNVYQSDDELLQGRFAQVVDERGQVFHYEFDANGFPTKKIYDKDSAFETFETWTYGPFYKVTRFRDREGRVTRFVYGARGELLERQEGILDINGVDVNQPEYAVYRNEYFPDTHVNRFMLKTAFTPMHALGETDVHRMDYTCDQYNRVTHVTGSAEQPGLQRPVTETTYDLVDSLGRRRHRVKDPEGRNTFTTFDVANRNIMEIHPDGSWSSTTYGVPGLGPANAAQRAFKTTDRTGITNYMTYDDEGRLYVVTENSGAATQQEKFLTSFTYYPDSALLKNVIRDSRSTKFEYDYRARENATHVYPHSSKTLTTRKVFLENRLHYIEDPYGRRRYVAYNENGTINRIRVLQYNRPYDQTNPPANRNAVMSLGRITTSNAPYTINDFQLDHSGNLIRITDGRDYPDVYVYDSRNRRKTYIRGAGVAGFHFAAVTTFNKDSTVSSVRSPRYNDATDANGYLTAQELFEYNGRSLMSKRSLTVSGGTVAQTSMGLGGPAGPSTGNHAEMEFFYHLDNKIRKHIDARDEEWTTDWSDDDGRFAGQKYPVGNGRFSNNDFEGRVTHLALLAQYDTHNDHTDPNNSTTRREITVRYDGLDRPIAITKWLSARNTVDPNSPPIAGLDGINKSAGITAQAVYDTRLFDGSGLDSAGGMPVSLLGGGTWNVNVQECLTKLAEPVANGGGGISFSSGRAGGATVVINGEEEVRVHLTDAVGRTVMEALIEGPHGNNPNSLISWNCTVYDTLTNLAGFGKLLETKHVDAEGNFSSDLVDGGDRTLQTRDALGNITSIQVDAEGNLTSVRDANGVGYDATFDALGRMLAREDTYGSEITWTYDRADNVLSIKDSRNKTVSYEYDAANQIVRKTDRINGVSQYAYDLAGNLTELTDTENNTTSWYYNPNGQMTVTTFPDHVNGSTPNSPGYGKVIYGYDAAFQLYSKTDQTGAIVQRIHDLAGRVIRRDYRASAAGPVIDSDDLVYDHVDRLTSGTRGRFANTVLRSYDDAGRLKSETLQIAGKDYTVQTEYDLRSLVSKLIYPDGTEVERNYTERGNLQEVFYEGDLYDNRTYDNGGRLETVTYRNGIVTTTNYREDTNSGQTDNYLANITTSHPSGVSAPDDKVGNYFYAYDANKNKTWESISGTSNPYGHEQSQFDFNDRLTQWTRSDGNKDQSWIISLEGDWDNFTEENVSVSRVHNAVHEIVSVGSSPLLHDVKGNVTQNTNANTYNWDFDNQLTGADIDGGGNDVFFQYDVLGRRVAKTVTGQYARVYVCSGPQVLMEYVRGSDATTGYRKFIYGSYADEPTVMFRPWNNTWAPQYYHRNSQYSIVALSWPSGKVAERYAYDAYGNPIVMAANGAIRSKPATDNPYLFTGRRWDDETGLYYFRARYYDAKLGRFISRDPAGFIDGHNLYRGYYVPNGVDPTGMFNDEFPQMKPNPSRLGGDIPTEIPKKHTPQDIADALEDVELSIKNRIQDHAEAIAKRKQDLEDLKNAGKFAEHNALLEEGIRKNRQHVRRLQEERAWRSRLMRRAKALGILGTAIGFVLAAPAIADAAENGGAKEAIGVVIEPTVGDGSRATLVEGMAGTGLTGAGVGKVLAAPKGLGGPIGAALGVIANQAAANYGVHPAQIQAEKEHQARLRGIPNVPDMAFRAAPKIGDRGVDQHGNPTVYSRPLFPWNYPYWKVVKPKRKRQPGEVIHGGTKGW